MTDKELSRGDDEPGHQDGAEDVLTATLYHELRKVAIGRMSSERGPQTLQATALVHEAWLRLGGDHQPDWANRAQFFSAAAEAMRRILVDRARRRRALRHGGGKRRIDLDATQQEFAESIEGPVNDDLLIALHEALDQLNEVDSQSASLIKLRYFAGMTAGEAAKAFDLSQRTAERRLSHARAWLGREIKRSIPG